MHLEVHLLQIPALAGILMLSLKIRGSSQPRPKEGTRLGAGACARGQPRRPVGRIPRINFIIQTLKSRKIAKIPGQIFINTADKFIGINIFHTAHSRN